jgi:hypothetical protein
MVVPLPEYIAIKDIYGIRYLGKDHRIIAELKLIRPLIEIKYGLEVKLIFEDNNELFAGCVDIIDWDDLTKFLSESDLPPPNRNFR